MNIEDAKLIVHNVGKEQSAANIKKAQEYLAAGDIKGVCRVVRGNADWLQRHVSVWPELSTGIGEVWEGSYLSLRGNLLDGEMHGEMEEWHPNGVRKVRCTINNGQPEGVYEEWYVDGGPSVQAVYVNGLLDGLCEQYYESGGLEAQRRFTAGEEKQRDVWLPNGEIGTSTTYQNANSYITTVYEDGKPASVSEHKDGWHVSTTAYKDGRPYSCTTWLCGKSITQILPQDEGASSQKAAL